MSNFIKVDQGFLYRYPLFLISKIFDWYDNFLVINTPIIAVFSRMRGNKILERLTVQDSNTPHSCDYRYNITRLRIFFKPYLYR